ncbi:hypothetical protein [Psychrobacillus sp.]|uniref:hypothetical protein n=1 Tax=Psychrobacillus sp. TaxID=1871623 RepID=UPI0028BF04DA|nr:hypothetical protein [Psychrobacillus sp.]
MICPKCNKTINLKQELFNKECPHCYFYFYLEDILRISVYSYSKIDYFEDVYFKNIHQRIYNPYIHYNEDIVEPIAGAESMINHFIALMKKLIRSYAKEDILFMMVAIREFATWKIFDKNPWVSVRTRIVSHVITNVVASINEEEFGDTAISDETDFVSLFVYAEEIDKISRNIDNSKSFKWSPTLTQLIKTDIEIKELSDYHSYYEAEEFNKPEEITFDDVHINHFLEKREFSIHQIKGKVGKEIEKLIGFSFENLLAFREKVVEIAEKHEQIFEIAPLSDDVSMKVVFVFKEQLEGWDGPLERILEYLAYKPTKIKSNAIYNFSDTYLDYKFIFELENILAFGILDSSNSITMFENIVTTDHFIEEIFGSRATRTFQKAQNDIAYLMGMSIAFQFSKRDDYFVPMQEKNVPYVNIKSIVGNGIKKRIFNSQNQDLGDFDAVIIDKKNKNIIIYEIKYFKPSMYSRDLILKDRKILEDIPKIIARQEWMEEHVIELIKAWELEEGDYTVETKLMTARPNFYSNEINKVNKKLSYVIYNEVLRDI